MDWKNIKNYFETFPEDGWNEIFENAEYPWSPLAKIPQIMETFFAGRKNKGSITADKTVIYDRCQFKEGSYTVTKNQILETDFVDEELSIFIGAGTQLEVGAMIKNHSIIGRKCEIRQAAYLRGMVYVGDHSVVGHTTEMKNSIFIKHVEAGHFAYIGDSIIGSFVNIGAGTKLSNLEFRSLADKTEENFPVIPLKINNERIDPQMAKMGAIIGDGGETGCNSVLCPFTLLAKECWVMPNLCVTKGVYKQKSFLANEATIKKNRL